MRSYQLSTLVKASDLENYTEEQIDYSVRYRFLQEMCQELIHEIPLEVEVLPDLTESTLKYTTNVHMLSKAELEELVGKVRKQVYLEIASDRSLRYLKEPKHVV